MGWSGMRNGELLAAAEDQFDVLITMDQNMQHQQHLPRYDLAVTLLTSVSNRRAGPWGDALGGAGAYTAGHPAAAAQPWVQQVAQR